MIDRLARVHRPSNKGSIEDQTYLLLTQGPNGWRVQLRAEAISAQEARAIAAWLFVAADWIDTHESN